MRSARLLVWIASLMVLTAVVAHGYGAKGHRQITQKSFQILASSESASYDFYLGLRGQCPEIQDIRTRDSAFSRLRPAEMIIVETPAVDDYRDVEFVAVRGGAGGGGRDNPHRKDLIAIDDVAKTGQGSMSFTAFNHFIDIPKGQGVFDDYDGYSYRKGSASKNQYEKSSTVARSWDEKMAANISGFKVDEAINWWLNDEYVHTQGQSWYNACSPAMERYSFYGDRNLYPTMEGEMLARFPLANAIGSDGHGIPYSIFMPVDNMARYWYNRFVETKDPLALAPVMHAIQDVTIPHHAAGCMGNWHSRYEEDLDSKLAGWMEDLDFVSGVGSLVDKWSSEHSASPTTLEQGQWTTTPSIDWRIDQLVTWTALNAYEANRTAQGGFKDKYRLNESSAKRLATIATAMSVLVMKKAAGDVQSAPSGNRTTISQ